MMLVISVCNIYGNAYLACFQTTVAETMWFMIMDNLFEFLYFIDMTCCFCQEYLDEETFTEVTDVK